MVNTSTDSVDSSLASWYKITFILLEASSLEPFRIPHLLDWNDSFSPASLKVRNGNIFVPRLGTRKIL